MIHVIIHSRSSFTNKKMRGSNPVSFPNASEADKYIEEMNRLFPGILHTWEAVPLPDTPRPAAPPQNLVPISRWITQIAVNNWSVYALCNDGTLLVRRDEQAEEGEDAEWFALPPIPQPEPIYLEDLP